MNVSEFKVLSGSILFVIIVLGIVGNFVSFVIWTKGKRCKTYAGASYLIALAVSDTSVLCLSGSYFAVDYAFGVNLSDLNEFMCKLFKTAWHFTLLVSTWIVVCLTVERALAVRWPLKSGRWTNKNKSWYIIFSLVVVCFLPNLPWTIGSSLQPVYVAVQKDPNRDPNIVTAVSPSNKTIDPLISNDTDERHDATSEPAMKFDRLTCQDKPSSFIFIYQTEWHKWFIDFYMLYTVPLAIITTCNVIILITICKQNQQIKARDSTRSVRASESASRSMTARVVAISLVQCLSVGPYSIAVLIPDFIDNIETIESFGFLHVVFTCIWYINHSVNFILYSLFGTAFRRDCYAFFCRRCAFRFRRESPSIISSRSGTADVKGVELTNISIIHDE